MCEEGLWISMRRPLKGKGRQIPETAYTRTGKEASHRRCTRCVQDFIAIV